MPLESLVNHQFAVLKPPNDVRYLKRNTFRRRLTSAKRNTSESASIKRIFSVRGASSSQKPLERVRFFHHPTWLIRLFMSSSGQSGYLSRIAAAEILLMLRSGWRNSLIV